MILGTCLLSILALGAGQLEDKTIFISPGHGYYHHPSLGWTSQRPVMGQLVEDLETADTVFTFLADYLRRAGADVWPLRCECPSPTEVVVDNESPGYSELGHWASTSSGGYRGSARYAAVTAGGRQKAVFRPDIPEAGYYPVYLWYVAGTNRTACARVRIHLAGAVEEVCINQQRFGGTWRYVGAYYFFAGKEQFVEILADGGGSGKVVVADAIRIGGGRGDVVPNSGGAPSGLLRYEEAAVYWTRFQGAPASVYNPRRGQDRTDDVACRPLYAEWLGTHAQDPIYLSYHTNAGGGSGTESFVADGQPTQGSRRLQRLVHAEVVQDIRSAWHPAWKDRGMKRAGLGELRLLKTMPGILLEGAFHDHVDDLRAERSPVWRRILSRAIYQGIARYYCGDQAVFLPEPPRHVAAIGAPAGDVKVSWIPPLWGEAACGADAADGYEVQVSRNGRVFATVLKTAETNAVLHDMTGEKPVFIRVIAWNKGGRSLPSMTAGILLGKRGQSTAKILYVAENRQTFGVKWDMEKCPRTGKAIVRMTRRVLDDSGEQVLNNLSVFKDKWPGASCDFVEIHRFDAFFSTKYDRVMVDKGPQGTKKLNNRQIRQLAERCSERRFNNS